MKTQHWKQKLSSWCGRFIDEGEDMDAYWQNSLEQLVAEIITLANTDPNQKPYEQTALQYAIKVIEAYQDEIRAAIEDGKVPRGFCQGIIFREVLDNIEKRRKADQLLPNDMKILFLDIDGVVNCATTTQRHRGVIGIDPYMALLVGRIVEQTGCKVVLSSSWRHSPEGREEVRRQVVDFIDCTGRDDSRLRGKEIENWLKANPLIKCDHPTSCPEMSRAMCSGHPIERYAILDDDSDMLPGQPLFKTDWQTGLTEEIAEEVIEYLNNGSWKPRYPGVKK